MIALPTTKVISVLYVLISVMRPLYFFPLFFTRDEKITQVPFLGYRLNIYV